MGQQDYGYQQQMACPECEVCKSDQAAFWGYLREHKQKPFGERAELVGNVANTQFGTMNVLFWVLIIGAVFHKHVWDFAKTRIPKIKIEK